MKNIFDQLREATTHDERSLNAIAHAAGLRYASIYEFVKKGRDIKLTTAAKLATVLGLGLAPLRGVMAGDSAARRSRHRKVGR